MYSNINFRIVDENYRSKQRCLTMILCKIIDVYTLITVLINSHRCMFTYATDSN